MLKQVSWRAPAALVVALSCMSGQQTYAQSYPTRPVRMVVPFPTGGSTDIMARLTAQKMTEALGQQVIVDNRGGVGGIIGTDMVAKAQPDGYTLLMSSSITHTAGPSLNKKTPYNVLTDFASVTQTASVPLMFVINPSVPARSIKEFVALAKAKPGRLNYASPGNGTSGHLAAELFKSLAGIDVVHVPYKGGGPALTDLMGGQVQMLIISAVAALPQVKNGKLRALALTSLKRSPALPDIPTVAESGLPGYEVILWYGIFLPAKSPPSIVQRLNQEIVKIMNTPEMRERLAPEGGVPVGNTPEQFQEVIKADAKRWAEVIKKAGISGD